MGHGRVVGQIRDRQQGCAAEFLSRFSQLPISAESFSEIQGGYCRGGWRLSTVSPGSSSKAASCVWRFFAFWMGPVLLNSQLCPCSSSTRGAKCAFCH